MTYEYLNHEYTVRGLSTKQIAKNLNTSSSQVSRMLKRFNIPIRSKAEAQKLYLEKSGNHPTKGKARPEETKKSIGKGVIKTWEQKPQEEKDVIAKRAKKQYAKTGILLKKSGHKAVRQSSKEGSKLEKHLKEFLTNKGITVEFHKNMLTNEKLEVDMYLPDYKTVIEINGPSHYKPIRGEEVLQKQQKADAEKMGLIIQAGFLFIIVKNLKQYSLVRYDDVCNQVHEALTSPTMKLLQDKFVELEV